MVLVSEVAENIYEIQPEGNELDRFPLCTVFLVVDEKSALVETGCPAQIPDILNAVERLGYDVRDLSYIIPTHVHIDHGGAAGQLAQLLPQARVVSHPKAAGLFSDPIFLDKLMLGFRQAFGEDAGKRFGGVIPVPEDRILAVTDGEKISLGQRELQVIHTPGHDPNHLSFLDTRTGGLFCGDALGSYFSEIDVTMPPSAPATDPFLILQSITKLQEFHPEIIYFSHGRTTGRASEILQRYADDAGLCIKVALNGLKTGASDENIASKLADVLAKNSAKAREELLAWPYFIPVVVAGYRQYFNRSN